jgi:hypothetical protein
VVQQGKLLVDLIMQADYLILVEGKEALLGAALVVCMELGLS